jgi:eukaryotic-like serine/threonine-protein kinase
VPFDSKTLRAGGYDEIRRIIREDDPPLPTSRLQSLGPEAAEVASRRSTDAVRLRKELSGDLDWIAMKALEKESSRRYPSASELAADIQRHLRDEPVSAGLAGPVYRCRKFIRKHRLAVAGAAAVLALGVAIFSVAYIRVRLERASALRASYRANVAAAELLLRERQPYEAREHLQSCDPELRNWEWRYLWRETDTSLARMRPQGEFSNAPFPSTTGFAGSRICWNTQTTVECWDGPSYGKPAIFKFRRVLGMSQDAELAITDDDGIRVVEIVSGKTVSTCGDCKADRNSYYAVFSPDKSRIAMPSGPGTIVWEARTGRTVARIPAEHVLAFSPDGAELALGKLELWSVDKPHRVASLNPGGYVFSAAFSPDGRRLVSGSQEGSIRVWNLKSTAEPAVLAITGPQVQAVAFSADSRRVAATGYDRAVRIWLDDKLMASLAGFDFPTANSVAFSPDGKRLVAGWECCELAVWDATSYGGQFLPLAPGKATAMAVSPGSALLAAGFEDGRVALYGLDGTIVRGWPTGEGRIEAMAFSPDGKNVLTGGHRGAAQVWDVGSGAPGIELRGHSAAITTVAYSPDGKRLATGSADRTARLWDADSGRAITITLKDPVNSESFSPDGRELLTAAGDTSISTTGETPVRLWDASTGRLLREFNDPEPCWDDAPRCPAVDTSFSPDGRRLVATFPTVGKSVVWNTRTGAVLSRLRDGVYVSRVTFSSDGSRIVTASLDALRIWDAVHYERLLSMPLDESPRKLAFTPDGSRLLGLTESGVRMWQSLGPAPARRP